MPERRAERVPDPELTMELTVGPAAGQPGEPVLDLAAEPPRDELPESLAALMPEPTAPSDDEPVPPELLTEQSRMLAEQLAAELGGVTWPAPERIRALGRRRRRRVAVGVPAAVVLVFAAIWGLVGGLPGTGTGPVTVAGPPAAPGSDPTVTRSSPDPSRQPVQPGGAGWFPAVALLQPADLGLNFRISYDTSGSVGADLWPFHLADYCPAYAGLRVATYRDYLFSRGNSVGGDGPDGRVRMLSQQVTRYADDPAARTVVDEARRVVDACAAYEVPPAVLTGHTASADPRPNVDPSAPPSSATPSSSADPPSSAAPSWSSSSASPSAPAVPSSSAEPGATVPMVDPGARTGGRHTLRVLGDGFAGSQSLLVRQEVTAPAGTPEAGTVTLYAVVRVGDLVAVLESYDYDDARMRQLAGRAAAWLCPFANPRC
ncbi:hypothetical protein BDK92_2866 [Micromonospora pisi]|uniref:Uncharacterized protein n=1 Tax=Micromonospora pisi TaxID=589240 RepID=A0A495JIY9_9ACTN|nr:hypothetical protein [Micromonospora pisi]RKR88538.1 hypothetical protein BDK92_2866 [Micromonospora pisi]